MAEKGKAKYRAPGPSATGQRQDSDAIMEAYRNALLDLQQQSQASYDKAIMTLSGGALGVSFVLIKDVLGTAVLSRGWLLAAWLCWAVSCCSVLLSFLSSIHAFREAVKQVDESRIHNETPGGWFDKATTWLNVAGGILFVLGVVFASTFAYQNLKNIKGMSEQKEITNEAHQALNKGLQMSPSNKVGLTLGGLNVPPPSKALKNNAAQAASNPQPKPTQTQPSAQLINEPPKQQTKGN